MQFQLDIHTLIFILGFTHLMQVLIFYHQFRINKAYEGVGWWLLWSAVEVIGFGVMFLRSIPSLLPAIIIVQNTMLVAGTVFLYIGVRKFLGQRVNFKLLVPILAVFSITLIFFLFIKNLIQIRSGFINGTLAALSLITAHSLFVHKIKSISATANFLALIFLIHGGIFLYRSVMIFAGTPVSNFFVPTVFNFIPYFDALIISLLWSFGFIIMLNHRLNSEMAEAKEEMRLIFNTSPDAAIITRLADGKIIEFNEGYLRLSGYNDQDLNGKTTLEINIWKDISDRNQVINLLTTNGFCDNYEAVFVRKDKSEVIGLMSAKIITVQGSPHIISITRDITERRKTQILLIEKSEEIEAQNEELMQINEVLQQAKQKAEESDRLKTAFLANMSHEIRTPMNGILGFTELLKEPDLSGEEQEKYINMIEKGGQRLLNIINDIISISKIEAGQMDINLEETNINEQIEYIREFFEPEIESKGILLISRTPLPFDMAVIKTDREKVYAILTNLVKNSIKFTKQGSIEFGYELKKSNDPLLADELEFFVKDTGTGIPSDKQDAIFERFIQADYTRKISLQGAGLGLSISKAYVEMLGGTMRVSSEPGIGSTFFFTIPFSITNI